MNNYINTTLICDSYGHISVCKKITLQLKLFVGVSRTLESDWSRKICVYLTITKQKHLINKLAPRISSHWIMSRYKFNIGRFLSNEVWKVLQSDWLRKLLATCKNAEKSNKISMQLFTARQENREMTEKTESKHFTELPYFTRVQ